MKNSYVITCNNDKKNLFQVPYTLKGPLFVTSVVSH